MTRPLRSNIKRHLAALVVLALYFLLVMTFSWDGVSVDSQASVFVTLLAAALAYGVGYAGYPVFKRVVANLAGKPLPHHHSRH